MEDSLNLRLDSIQEVITTATTSAPSYWRMWILFGVFLVIIFLISIAIIKTKKIHRVRNEVLAKEDIDWDDKLRSMFQAKALYNEIKVKYHPDRFLDSTQNKIANELFQEITKNQHDFHKLEQLKQIAQEKLIRNEYDRS